MRDQTRPNVVQAWGQLQAAKAQIEAAMRQNDAAARALTGVRNEALAGQRTTQDVLNAEQTLVNARQNLIVAQHDRVVASYSLLSAVGRLSAQELWLPVSVYDPIGALPAGARLLDRRAHAERPVISSDVFALWIARQVSETGAGRDNKYRPHSANCRSDPTF